MRCVYNVVSLYKVLTLIVFVRLRLREIQRYKRKRLFNTQMVIAYDL